MAELRTKEQVDADENLAQAINRARDAYVEGEKGIITEYLVLFATRTWDDANTAYTAIGHLISDPPEPIHHQLGMLNLAAVELEETIKNG